MQLFFKTAALCVAIAFFIDYFVLTEARKEAFRKFLQERYRDVANSNRIQLLYNNFLVLEYIGNKMFGTKLFSAQVVKQTIDITSAFLVATFVLALLPGNFGVRLSPKPWEIVTFTADVGQVLALNIQEHPDKYKFTPNIQHAMIAIGQSVATIDKPYIRAEFTVVCMFSFWLLGIGLNLISVVISRWLLRELIQAKGILIMLPSLVFCFTLLLVLASLGLLTLCDIMLMPLTTYQLGLLWLATKASVYLGLWVLFSLVLAAWGFSTIWMKFLILIPLVPLAMVAFTILFTVFTAPWRNHVYYYINRFVLWTFGHKHGPLAVITGILTVVFQSLMWVADLLGGK